MIPNKQIRLLPLPTELQTRLDVIVSSTQGFWENHSHYLYRHYTRQGFSYSWRVYQNLAQLIKEFSISLHLTDDEVFISSAAAWLYEIGMQSPPSFVSDLGVTTKPNATLQEQLDIIRNNKHKLTDRMILESISKKKTGLSFGLSPDDYTDLIAKVCQWISDDPIEGAPDILPIYGTSVRISLLATLLRLADQLYIEGSRIDLEVLKTWKLTPIEKLRWRLYPYTKVAIEQGKIHFFYSLPLVIEKYMDKIRTLFEAQFDYSRNPTIQYLWDKYNLSLIPTNKQPILDKSHLLDKNLGLDAESVRVLDNDIIPIEEYADRALPERIHSQAKKGEKIDEVKVKGEIHNVPQIFISYASEDEKQAESLYEKLDNEGFRPWMEKKDILPGQEVPTARKKAIEDSDVFLALFSKTSVQKRDFQKGQNRLALSLWEEKLEDDIFCIPIRLDECEIPDGFRRFQRFDLFSNNDLSPLVKAISTAYERQCSS